MSIDDTARYDGLRSERERWAVAIALAVADGVQPWPEDVERFRGADAELETLIRSWRARP